MPDGVFAVDEEFNLLFINPSCTQLLNLDPSSKATFFDVVGAFNRHYPIEEVVNQVFKSQNSHKVAEVKIESKYFQVSAFPIAGSKPEVAVFISDRTEDAEVLQKHEEYMAMLVHDLRSPLTVVKGMSELLLGESENLTKEKQMELLTQMKNSSAELLDIVNSLLEDTKEDLMRFEVKKVPGDINGLIKLQAENYKGTAEEKGLQLVVDLDEKVGEISFDKAKMTHVIDNLLSNALKFTSSGAISIKSKGVGGGIQISVADTGEGIPENQKEMLFKKFSQLENSKHISAEGTGLGLSIAKGIIEAHGGEIWVEDNKPHGAVFVFTLPS